MLLVMVTTTTTFFYYLKRIDYGRQAVVFTTSIRMIICDPLDPIVGFTIPLKLTKTIKNYTASVERTCCLTVCVWDTRYTEADS